MTQKVSLSREAPRSAESQAEYSAGDPHTIWTLRLAMESMLMVIASPLTRAPSMSIVATSRGLRCAETRLSGPASEVDGTSKMRRRLCRSSRL